MEYTEELIREIKTTPSEKRDLFICSVNWHTLDVKSEKVGLTEGEIVGYMELGKYLLAQQDIFTEAVDPVTKLPVPLAETTMRLREQIRSKLGLEKERMIEVMQAGDYRLCVANGGPKRIHTRDLRAEKLAEGELQTVLVNLFRPAKMVDSEPTTIDHPYVLRALEFVAQVLVKRATSKFDDQRKSVTATAEFEPLPKRQTTMIENCHYIADMGATVSVAITPETGYERSRYGEYKIVLECSHSMEETLRLLGENTKLKALTPPGNEPEETEPVEYEHMRKEPVSFANVQLSNRSSTFEVEPISHAQRSESSNRPGGAYSLLAPKPRSD